MDVSAIEIQQGVGWVSYPVSRDDLIERATLRQASERVMAALAAIPDQMYVSPDEIGAAVAAAP